MQRRDHHLTVLRPRNLRLPDPIGDDGRVKMRKTDQCIEFAAFQIDPVEVAPAAVLAIRGEEGGGLGGVDPEDLLDERKFARENNVGKLVAIPLFMDLSPSESKEIDALIKRSAHVVTLMQEKGCEGIPELPVEEDDAPTQGTGHGSPGSASAGG